MIRAFVWPALLFGALGVPQANLSAGSEIANATPASVRFEFTRTVAPVPHWILEMSSDGQGRYQEAPVGEPVNAENVRKIRVSPEAQKRLFAAYAAVKGEHCETRQKHIANTGAKKLTYRIENANQSSCTFNYSDDEKLNDTANAFLAIAETMQAGERLARKHRYDRLGLDAEIDSLTAEVKAGQAIEVANIEPVLKSIVDDERLMERVQRKAARLLQEAGAGTATADSAR